MKAMVQLFGVALLAGAVLASASGAAHAKKNWCQYMAWDNAGNEVIGNATRKKESSACKVAKRRCVRRLERKQRKGKFGRSKGCVKVVEA
ncbi:MAG: hypothetical protein ACRBBJ_05580 [Rhodomicrobiaceae bacterium]